MAPALPKQSQRGWGKPTALQRQIYWACDAGRQAWLDLKAVEVGWAPRYLGSCALLLHSARGILALRRSEPTGSEHSSQADRSQCLMYGGRKGYVVHARAVRNVHAMLYMIHIPAAWLCQLCQL